VQVNPNGSKLWHLKYRFADKEKRLAFGPYPTVTLVMAREQQTEAGDSGRPGSEIEGGEETPEESPPAGRVTIETYYFRLAGDSP